LQEKQCQTVSQEECQVSQYSAGAAVPDSQPGGVPGESVLCRSSSARQSASRSVR